MSTNILSLDRAIQNTILWLNDIQEELQWENRDTVYKATKAVLQTIRDRLPFEEVVHFSANLPLIMKGMLMDGYDLKDKPLKMKSVEEFYEYIQQYYDAQRRDIINSRDAARAVINVLNKGWAAAKCRKLPLTCLKKLGDYSKRQASKPRKRAEENWKYHNNNQP